MVMGKPKPCVENCANTLILRCSGSENGGTSQFASRLIGEREIVRRQVSRGNDRESIFASRGARRSRSVTDQHVTEMAVLPSELEQLPDFCGYFKRASSAQWLKVSLRESHAPDSNVRSRGYFIARAIVNARNAAGRPVFWRWRCRQGTKRRIATPRMAHGSAPTLPRFYFS